MTGWGHSVGSRTWCLLLTAAVWACGPSAAPVVPAPAPPPAPPAPRHGPGEAEYVRVELERDEAGKATIVSTQRLFLPTERAPEGPADGSHAVAAFDASGTPLSAQLVWFPADARIGLGEGTQRRAALGRSFAVAYVALAPGTTRVVLLDRAGEVLAGSAVAAIGNAPPALTPAAGTDEPAELGCPHVQLDHARVPSAALAMLKDQGLTTVEAGPKQLAAVALGLRFVSPLLCSAVRSITFARATAGGLAGEQARVWTAASAGGHLFLNTERFGEEELAKGKRDSERSYPPDYVRHDVAGHVVHNVAHIAEELLGHLTTLEAGEGWGKVAAKSAGRVKALRDAHLLGTETVASEWAPLHLSFERAKLAAAYGPRAERDEWSDEQLGKAGFMSAEAGTDAGEDLAAVVQHVTMSRRWSAIGESSRGSCDALRAYKGRPFPREYAAVLAKVAFAHSLQLVEVADVEACLGDTWLPSSLAPGVHIFPRGSAEVTTVFDGNVEQSAALEGGRAVYEVTVDGSLRLGAASAPAKALLRAGTEAGASGAPRLKLARGWYHVARDRDVLAGQAYFALLVPSDKRANVEVVGDVAIIESSLGGVTGAVYPERMCRPDAGASGALKCADVENPPDLILFRAPGKRGVPAP